MATFGVYFAHQSLPEQFPKHLRAPLAAKEEPVESSITLAKVNNETASASTNPEIKQASLTQGQTTNRPVRSNRHRGTYAEVGEDEFVDSDDDESFLYPDDDGTISEDDEDLNPMDDMSPRPSQSNTSNAPKPRPSTRIPGGKPAMIRIITFPLDEEDQMLKDMKDQGHQDAEIAQTLIDNGFTKYSVKSIATRYTRIQRLINKEENKRLDDELSDWHDGDDDVLHNARAKHQKDLEREIEKLKDEYWQKVAHDVHSQQSKMRFSKDACRERGEALDSGDAIPTLESDPDQERRMAMRQQREVEHTEKRRLAREEERRKQEAKEEEEHQRALRDEARREREGVWRQKRVEREQEQENRRAAREEERKKQQAKKLEQEEAARQKKEESKIKAEHRKHMHEQRKQDREELIAARRANELKQKMEKLKARADLAEKRMEEEKRKQMHRQILWDFFGSKKFFNSAPDGKKDAQKGGATLDTTKRKIKQPNATRGNDAPPSIFAEDDDDEECKMLEPKQEEDNEDPGEKPISSNIAQDSNPREKMTTEDIRKLAIKRDILELGPRRMILARIARTDETMPMCELVSMLEKRGLAGDTSDRAELTRKLATDDAGLLKGGSRFHERLKQSRVVMKRGRYVLQSDDEDGSSSRRGKKRVKLSGQTSSQGINIVRSGNSAS